MMCTSQQFSLSSLSLASEAMSACSDIQHCGKGNGKGSYNDDMPACSGGQRRPWLEVEVRAAWKRYPHGWVSTCIADFRDSKRRRIGALDEVEAQELNDYLNDRRDDLHDLIRLFRLKKKEHLCTPN